MKSSIKCKSVLETHVNCADWCLRRCQGRSPKQYPMFTLEPFVRFDSGLRAALIWSFVWTKWALRPRTQKRAGPRPIPSSINVAGTIVSRAEISGCIASVLREKVISANLKGRKPDLAMSTILLQKFESAWGSAKMQRYSIFSSLAKISAAKDIEP